MMQKTSWSGLLRWLLAICAAGVAFTALAQADPATALREKFTSLGEQLRQNQFRRPLVVDSSEAPNGLQGDIHAIVAYPFGAVSAGLNRPEHWCDVMMLHINTKYCQ